MKERGSFKSKFGVIAAVGGSVVGLGNIWRFPYIAGENGGAAFILVYILMSFIIAVPVMISEFAIGRDAKTNSMKAFSMLAPKTKWSLVGLMGIATAIVILSFYSVIAGWALEFLIEAIGNNFADKSAQDISTNLTQFINSGYKPIIWIFIFVAATAFVIYRGVEKGIEKYNKILMPVLALILLGLAINSFTMPGFSTALNFLLRPDFSKINGSVMLQALGQAFFSLSLGMGCMITYGSYIKNNQNIMRIAYTVSITDVSIAILSGLAIFPAVFSFGINPTSGAELVFVTLPNIFKMIPGGYFISILFFFLLFIAAITSSVSLMEVVTAYLTEEFKVKRLKAIIIAGATIMTTGSLCALSQIDGSSLRFFGNDLFVVFDRASSVYLMPIGGLLTVIFTGWVLSPKILRDQITTNGQYGRRLFPLFRFLMKFIAPVVISILFLNMLGIIK